jgi:hypothetical protein
LPERSRIGSLSLSESEYPYCLYCLSVY